MANWRAVFRQLRDLPNTVGRPLSRAYIPELDGLRFLALIFVLIWHASIRATRDYAISTGPGGGDGYYWMFPHGEVGVTLFFFISGFVVSQPFLNRPSSEWNTRSFYIRRFIRIYPPYLIALTLCFLALQVVGYVPADAKSYHAQEVPLTSSYLASALYVHSFVFNSASRLNPPTWSLELEVVFYIVAPLLLFFYTRIAARKTRLLSLGASVLGLMVVTAFAASQLSIDGRYRWGLLSHGYLFLLGILVADGVGGTLSRPRKTGTFPDFVFLLGFATIVAIGLHMTRIDARLSGGGSTLVLQLTTALSLPMIFVGAFYGTLSSRFLSLSWIRLIGTMCYSVYLTHIVTMQACGELLDRFVRLRDPTLIWGIYFAVLIPAGLAAGLVFYICVERPFAAMAADAGRRAPVATTATSAAPRTTNP